VQLTRCHSWKVSRYLFASHAIFAVHAWPETTKIFTMLSLAVVEANAAYPSRGSASPHQLRHLSWRLFRIFSGHLFSLHATRFIVVQSSLRKHHSLRSCTPVPLRHRARVLTTNGHQHVDTLDSILKRQCKRMILRLQVYALIAGCAWPWRVT
jgi:hypothetical protein